MYITQHERAKGESAQREAIGKYYKLTLWFIALYFGGHFLVAIARYFV